MKIQKLSKLKNANSYIQAKFIHGYKYIDSAGEILNYFEKDDGTISYNMSPERLVVHTPHEHINAIKVSNHDLWIHSENPLSLNYLEGVFLKDSERILAITGVKQLQNIGWRNQFIFEKEGQRLSLNHFRKVKNADLTGVSFQRQSGGITVNLAVSLLEDNITGTRSALLLDVDAFIKDSIDVEDIATRLSSLRDMIKSVDVLSLVNVVLELL